MTRKLAQQHFAAPEVPCVQIPSPKISYPFATLEARPGVEVRMSGWFHGTRRLSDSATLAPVYIRLVRTYRKHLTQPDIYAMEYEYQVIDQTLGPLFAVGKDEALHTLNSERTPTGNLVWSYRQDYLSKWWSEDDSALQQQQH